MNFDELISSPALLRAIADLDWSVPTPIQAKAIPLVKTGRDVVGIAQTGTGKTGAFLLPALESQEHGEGLRTLVVCPTRELAQQVADDARALCRHVGLFVGEIYGGVPIGPQIRDLRAGFDIMAATPGRLIDHIERGNVDLSEIEVLVLDEADRMLDMGFRPQIERVLRELPKERQTLLFSATMPNGVHALALRILNDPEWIEATPQSTAAETVTQVVYSVRPDRKPELLLHLLENADMDQVLVFTRTKRGADLLHYKLDAAGVHVAITHGDRNMKQRTSALEAFSDGKKRVLVATDVAQRGLDIEGISHVVNYDVPQDPEDYVHRIGRTGRAGASGDAITFMTAAEFAQVRSIEHVLGYRIEKISLPDYDYGGGLLEPEPRAESPKRGRTGRAIGQKDASSLSPEELEELLDVG